MKIDGVANFETSSWAVLFLDEKGRVQWLNRVGADLLGEAASAEGLPLTQFLELEKGESARDWGRRLAAAGSGGTRLNLRLKSGAVQSFQAYFCQVSQGVEKGILLQCFSWTGPAVGAGGGASTPSEVTEIPGLGSEQGTLALESLQSQKQKLDCALQLARTVALDFNNALTSILGHTSLILARMEPNHPWRQALVEVEKSAEKAAETASDLAAFSRQERDGRNLVPGNLNHLLERTVALFQKPENAEVEWRLQMERRLYTVNFDEAKMQQAFAKILDNAIQALPGRGGIELRSRNLSVNDEFSDGVLRLPHGDYVCVEITDHGCGISEEILPRIFEPFFTNKESPPHRGLGLAWVYGIVTNHGGSVAVSSTVGLGTTVRVYLPAQRRIVKAQVLSETELTGTETVLIVDDEDLLLSMGQTVLSTYGYRVLTANSGPRALEVFRQAPEKIDLVLTDMVMPTMGGRELIEHLRRISPTIRVLCCSGYFRSNSGEEDEIYLRKPFTSQELLRRVKQALQQPTTT